MPPPVATLPQPKEPLVLPLPAARGAMTGTLTQTRVGKLHAIVRGKGPDVVLVHGITDNAGTWDVVQRELARSFRVHAVDLPGHGYSDVPDRPLLVLEMGDAVHAYMDAAGIGRAVLAGASLGGGVVLAVAHRIPERVERLVTLGGIGVPFRTPPGLATLKLPRIAESMALFSRDRRLRRFLLRETFGPGFHPDEDTVRRYWHGWRVEERAVYIRSLMRTLDVSEPRAWLPSIRLPVRVLHGTADRVIPFHVGQTLARELPQAVLFPLDGVGHMPQIERPDTVVAHVRGDT